MVTFYVPPPLQSSPGRLTTPTPLGRRRSSRTERIDAGGSFELDG
jgi:hypothetical protein